MGREAARRTGASENEAECQRAEERGDGPAGFPHSARFPQRTWLIPVLIGGEFQRTCSTGASAEAKWEKGPAASDTSDGGPSAAGPDAQCAGCTLSECQHAGRLSARPLRKWLRDFCFFSPEPMEIKRSQQHVAPHECCVSKRFPYKNVERKETPETLSRGLKVSPA